MRFVLPLGTMGTSTAEFDAVDTVLNRVLDEVHILVMRDAELVESSAWFRGLRTHRQEFVRSIVRASAFTPRAAAGPHRIEIVIGKDMAAREAARISMHPLLILVENDLTDGLLVRASIAVYAKAEVRKLFSLSCVPEAVRLESRGGQGELLKLVEHTCKAAADSGVPARVIVLTDSDARFPGEISTKAQEITSACDSLNVPVVVLSCRSIENYIPDAGFQLWSNPKERTSARNAVEALCRLPASARDHYPIKGKKGSASPAPNRGLAAIDRGPNTPAEQRRLFDDVSPADRRDLDDGFPDTVISILDELLPELTAADFDARDTRGDLRRLVNLITESL
jgi:hypothetical protein